LPRPVLGEAVDRAVVAVLREMGEENRSRLARLARDRLPSDERRSLDSIKKRIPQMARDGYLRRDEVRHGRTVVYTLNTDDYDFADVAGRAQGDAERAAAHVRAIRERVVRPWRRQVPEIGSDGVLRAPPARPDGAPLKPWSLRLPVESEPQFADLPNHVGSAADDPTPAWAAFQRAARSSWVWREELRDGFLKVFAAEGWRVSKGREANTATPEAVDWLILFALALHAGEARYAAAIDARKPRLFRPRGGGHIVIRLGGDASFHAPDGEDPAEARARAGRAWERAKAWARGEGAPLARQAGRAREDLARCWRELDHRLARCEKVLVPNPDCPFIES
jgi:hypothetical protein